MQIEHNREQYESVLAVENYMMTVNLQMVELKVFNSLRKQLNELDFLDIGIGGGRTTIHIAPFVKSYTGVDYSSGLINSCNERFINYKNNVCFFEQDARNMLDISSETKDFVFFSYNGIDYVDSNSRILAIHEILRVMRPGAKFFFSTHNLNSIIYRPVLRKLKHPMRFISELCGSILHFSINNLNRRKDFLIFKDTGLNGQLDTYYVQPEHQIEELKGCGFRNIVVIDNNGNTLNTKLDFLMNKDPWLYYICEK